MNWCCQVAFVIVALLHSEGVSQGADNRVDLIITHASVFDSETGNVRPDQTILINGGRILAVMSQSEATRRLADKTIDAAGRFVTPGFIDVHHHTDTILGDSVTAGGGMIQNLSMHPDSIQAYRRRFAAAYMPYGVTTVREAGGDDRYLEMSRVWMTPVPWAPDFYPSGGALVSHEEGRTPYASHTEVMSPEAAAAKVREYHDLGFKYVKLYWRLREPELIAALETANELEMVPFAHIDFGVVSITRALELGVRDFEHAYTLVRDMFTEEEIGEIWTSQTQRMLQGRPDAAFFVQTFELMNAIGYNHRGMIELIDRMAELDASVTPTLHVFAQVYSGLTYFRSPPKGKFNDTSELEDEIIERGVAGFRIMQSYVWHMFHRGIRLNLGTDCLDPGRAALSELLLMHEAGIPIPAVLQIATINGARTMRIEDEVGTIAPGKRAHLIIFDESPFDDLNNLLSEKTVIKDGVVQ